MQEGRVVNPPNLGRAVNSLVNAVEKLTTAIYNLQTALNNALSQSDTVLNEVTRSRSQLSKEFEGYVALLEDSCQYAKEYVNLRKVTEHGLAARLSFASSLPPIADAICRQASDIRDRHQKISQAFLRHKPKISKALSGSSSAAGATSSKFIYLSAHHYSTNRAGDRRIVQDNRSDFMRVAVQAAHPHGPSALDESCEGMEQISVCLRNVFVFWDDQHRRISRYTPQAASKILSGHEFSAESRVWEEDLRSLRRCIDSITYFSDAIKVNPPPRSGRSGSSKKRIEPAQRPGLIQRFLRFISGK